MNIGIIRCERNDERCPLTSCIKSLQATQEAFSGYENPQLVGVFSCHCPGDGVARLGKILKAKGAQAIHFCTCTFSHKQAGEWVLGNGFCDHIDEILKQLSEDIGLPCVKGTAHLPEAYHLQSF